ncbi:MAG TPA: hypothetical protein VED63_08705, partial [Acidimicrobiales bacterium]|nr:hypothetical protein [Acidimicrobiales bacterium]
TTLNQISTVGAFIVGASFVFFLVNMLVSWARPVPAGDNPWDGHALEWFTTSPPSHHNFDRLPPIRSERPVWDFNHPDALTVAHGQGNDRAHDETVAVGATGTTIAGDDANAGDPSDGATG